MDGKLHELLFPVAAWGPSTASDEILPCNGRVDDGCVVKLVCRGCNPAASMAIVVALGWTAVDAVAELVGGSKGGGT